MHRASRTVHCYLERARRLGVLRIVHACGLQGGGLPSLAPRRARVGGGGGVKRQGCIRILPSINNPRASASAWNGIGKFFLPPPSDENERGGTWFLLDVPSTIANHIDIPCVNITRELLPENGSRRSN